MIAIANRIFVKPLGFLFFVGGFIGCKQNADVRAIETIKIADYLLIDAPKGSKLISKQGIDSYSEILVVNTKDSFDIEYGSREVVNDAYDLGPTIWGFNDKDSLLKNKGFIPPTDEVIFSKTPEQDKNQNIYDEEYYYYDSTNGIVKKIIQPKLVGTGITGTYIPELENGKSLGIYSKNLDSASHRMAISIFKTIRYTP